MVVSARLGDDDGFSVSPCQTLDVSPPSRSINSLLIVEDDGMLLEVLVEESRRAAHGCAVFGASSIAAAHEVLQNHRIDAALVDLGLPDGDGIRLIADIKRREPGCEVLVITVFADKDRVLQSLRAGASGYLLKTDLPQRIDSLIETISAGGSPLSPSIARHLIEVMRPEGSIAARIDPSVSLSEREFEILRLCSKGLRYAEIARVLTLSTHTVNTHLKTIYRKLMVNSRAEAVYEARRMGLLHD